MAGPPSSPSHSSNEEEIRDLVLSNPEQGWKRFWDEYRGFVQRMIRKYRFSPEDCDEVFQEIGLRLLGNNASLLRNWDPQRCPLKGYLGVVTVSGCINFYRSKFYRDSTRQVDFPGQLKGCEKVLTLADPTPSPAERLERILLLEKLHHRLDNWSQEGTLREEDRAILEAHLAGLGHAEIGTLLGIPRDKVANRLYRLKDRLGERLRRTELMEPEQPA